MSENLQTSYSVAKEWLIEDLHKLQTKIISSKVAGQISNILGAGVCNYGFNFLLNDPKIKSIFDELSEYSIENINIEKNNGNISASFKIKGKAKEGCFPFKENLIKKGIIKKNNCSSGLTNNDYQIFDIYLYGTKIIISFNIYKKITHYNL